MDWSRVEAKRWYASLLPLYIEWKMFTSFEMWLRSLWNEIDQDEEGVSTLLYPKLCWHNHVKRRRVTLKAIGKHWLDLQENCRMQLQHRKAAWHMVAKINPTFVIWRHETCNLAPTLQASMFIVQLHHNYDFNYIVIIIIQQQR